MNRKVWTQEEIDILTKMDNVASQGQLMVGMGIISQEEKTLIG